MKIYRVGGSVRDLQMGKTPHDFDYVVVGSTPEEMLADGYIQVGADFPVFLHPETKHEYALARTERKSGKGYLGFTVDASQHVTLEQDLGRRDLTINSLAVDDEGNLIDPFGGMNDIQHKILRHTSPAFAEDPLRVIRLARFASRFPDFVIANETVELAREIAFSGRMEELSKERFYSEMEKVFEQGGDFYIFIRSLYTCKAFWDISFFRDLFGTWNSRWAWTEEYLNHINCIQEDLKLPGFIALISDDAKQESTVIPTHVKMLTKLLSSVRHMPKMPDWVLTFLKVARAFSEGSYVCDVIILLAIAEKYEDLSISSQEMRIALDAARSVKSDAFLHLKGAEIGAAIDRERIIKIQEALNESTT